MNGCTLSTAGHSAVLREICQPWEEGWRVLENMPRPTLAMHCAEGCEAHAARVELAEAR